MAGKVESKKVKVGSSRTRAQDRPARIGETDLALLVVAVPIAIHPYSINTLDIKNLLLGVGVSLGLALWLIASFARGRISYTRNLLTVCLLAFFTWSVLTLSYSHYRFATISEVGKLAAGLGLYLLVIASVTDLRQVRLIIGAAALGAIPICIYGLIQAAGHDPIEWEMSGTRIFSFQGNPTYFAGYIILLTPLIAAIFWPARVRESTPLARFWLITASLVVILLLICLYFSLSFGPIIGLGLGTMLMLLVLVIRGGGAIFRRLLPLVAGGLLLLLALGFFGYQRLPRSQQWRVQRILRGEDPFGKERGMIQQVGIDLFREQRLLGKGYGTYSNYALERLAPEWYGELGKSTKEMLIPNYAHNEFISILAELGIIGGALFLVLLLAAYRAALLLALRHPDPAWSRIGLAGLVALTAFLFQNLFGVTFRQSGTVMFFWLLLGFLSVGQARMTIPQDTLEKGLRIRFFRPLPIPALVLVSGLLLGLVALLAWAAVRPVIADTLVRKAEHASHQKLYAAAAEYADRAIALNPYSIRGYYIDAFAWGSLGDNEKSLRANERALVLLPGNASVYYNLAINKKRLGRLEEARKDLMRAIELMPTSMRHHAAMSELLMQMGKLDEALSYAEKAEQLEPQNADVHMLLADIQSRRKQYPAALAQLETAGVLAPRNPSIQQQLAKWYAQLRRNEDVVKAAQRWATAAPRETEAYVYQGSGYYNLKQYAAARDAFQLALRLNPNHLQARLRLAFALAQLKQFPESKREFVWVAQKYPETREGREAARMLALGSRR